MWSRFRMEKSDSGSIIDLSYDSSKNGDVQPEYRSSSHVN